MVFSKYLNTNCVLHSERRMCETYLWACLYESVSSMYHIPYYPFSEVIILLFSEVTVLQLMVTNWALSTVIIVKQENKGIKAFR